MPNNNLKKLLDNGSCFTCGEKDNLHRHHFDWNNKNNNLSNIEILCERCHTAIHRSCGYLSHSELIAVRLAAQERNPDRFSEIINQDNWIGLGG